MKPGCLLFIFITLFLTSCDVKENNKELNTVDQLPVLKLGNTYLSADNYAGDRFRNGDSIPEAKSAEDWLKAGINETPAWSYFNNDSVTGKKYGKIYNWYAINDPRGFSPPGWHVPTHDEWIQLENDITTDSGFNKLLGGYRSKEGIFTGINEFSYLFSSSERDSSQNDIWGRGLHRDTESMMRCGMYKGHGLYVRLIKN
jgi:hypothetical protein